MSQPPSIPPEYRGEEKRRDVSGNSSCGARSVDGVVVASRETARVLYAHQLASELGLRVFDGEYIGDGLFVIVGDDRLELHHVDGSKREATCVDFVAGATGHRLRQGGQRGQLLAKAVGGPKSPTTVLDASAGLGRDAFLLASICCNVIAVERHPVVAALLRDGLARAAASAKTEPVAGRIRLIVGDARDVLADPEQAGTPAVVYIDTMFPPKSKSALAKKEMRLCRLLTGPDDDAGELWAAAMRVATRRVVVKRWLRSPVLAGEPDVQFKGRTVRFDVYLTKHS